LKIKLLNSLIIIDILTILLVLAILFLPSSVVRIILGVPFLLFFPGYTLMAAIFAKKQEMDGTELIAFSFGSSIAIVGLIGFGLNYTIWGIRLEPVLYSVAAFIIVVSTIALILRTLLYHQAKLTVEFKLSFPAWRGSIFSKSITIVLIVLVLGSAGTLGYIASLPEIAEEYTEFYVLGYNGKAQDYPSEFIISNGEVTRVRYGSEIYDSSNKWGKVTIGIINHEQQEVSYSVAVKIDGQQVDFRYNGSIVSQVDQIDLPRAAEWEGKIEFVPSQIGNKQEVELLLYRNGGSSSVNTVHFWIDVKGD
jgi:uncharacterized membrane protein